MDRDLDVYRALFEGTAEAIVVVDDGGEIILANPACRALLGYDAESLVGRSVESLVPVRFTGHPARHLEFLEHPRARPMGQGIELFARAADGRDVPVDISITPLVVGGRRLAGCVLRRRLSSLDSLRVQATALRSAANGVVITDRVGTITWVNPAACRITGYAEDDLVGSNTRVLKSGQHADGFYADLWRTVLSGQTWSGTIVNRRKDGSLYDEEQTIAPVVDDSGQISHFIAIKQDVSQQRQTQTALVTAHLRLAEHVAEIEKLNRQLREQAIRDPLTGLYNRRYLEDTVARDMARLVSAGRPVALAVIDVDHFKEVNDTHGHITGDLLLRRLASVLLAQVRASDFVCRLGGDELIVVLPGAGEAVAVGRAERWRAAAARARIQATGQVEVRLTLSVGIACFRDPGEGFEAALRRADAALYRAKADGRDRVVSADVETNAPGHG